MSTAAATETPEPVLVYGHLNPDIDAVLSTLIGAMYLEKRGILAKPILLSPMDPITKRVIEGDLGLTAPPVVTDWAGVLSGHRVFAVDHHTHANGVGSAIGATLNVIGLVDHHQGKVSMACPREGLFYAYAPDYPSASYMLVRMMQDAGDAISQEVMHWAVVASLVDTCCLRMPDPHNQGPIVRKWVAQLGFDFAGLEAKYLFDLDPTLPPEQLIMCGPKTYEKNGFNITTSYIEIFKMTPERREALCGAIKYLFEKYRPAEPTRTIGLVFVKDFEQLTTKYFCAGSREFRDILYAHKPALVDDISGEEYYKELDGIHGRNSFVSLFYDLVDGK